MWQTQANRSVFAAALSNSVAVLLLLAATLSTQNVLGQSATETPDLLPTPNSAEVESVLPTPIHRPMTPAELMMNWPQHRDPDDYARHRGIGEPLEGTSWLNRPYHFDWIVGGVFGDNLTSTIEQSNSIGGGFRLGWDFDHYYGTEMRFLFYELEVRNNDQESLGIKNENWIWDVSFNYYPWGDARWRPFVGLGLGFSGASFADPSGAPRDETMLILPIHLGIKYQMHRWMALRADFSNNISFGAGQVHARNDVSLALGMELRFGAKNSHKKYYPYR